MEQGGANDEHERADAPADPAQEPQPPLWKRTAPAWSVGAFVVGFAWDSLTLSRVDRLTDNLLLLGYLLALGMALVAHHRVAALPERWPRLALRVGWLDTAVKFLFGCLYSAYVVYYFKSATPGRSFVFLGLLVGLLVANEFFGQRMRTGRLRLALYCLCAFSFLLFFVPVATGFPGPGLFTIAAVGAFALTSLVGALMFRGLGDRPLRQVLRPHALGWLGLLGGLFLLDGLGLVPPVPLALMGGGIFHEVERTDEGYVVTWETPSWRHRLRRDDRVFRQREGEKAVCFSAVFAPTGMQLAIVHVWEFWDPELGWTVSNRTPFEVRGGRDRGYRGYTWKRHLKPGHWRVRVVTGADREIGRYAFEVVEGPHPEPVWRTTTFD